MRRLRKRGRPYCQCGRRAAEELEAYCVHQLGVRAGATTDSGLGLPLGRTHRRAGPVAVVRPSLRLQSFTAPSSTHTGGGLVTTVCAGAAQWLVVMQGGCRAQIWDSRPESAEPRTATARTLADRSFHGMMDKALKLLLSVLMDVTLTCCNST